MKVIRVRDDWPKWRDLKFVRSLAHGDMMALMGGDDMNGCRVEGCTCAGWLHYHPTDSGHAEYCPLHPEMIRQMELNPR